MHAEAMSCGGEDLLALGERIAETAALIDAATHRLLTDLRRFDEAEGWAREGALSCAHWLAWRTGMDLGAARERVRVARALGSLPAIDAALARAEISYSKARALSRVATPENQAELLELAGEHTAAQLERICRLYRPALPQDDRRWMRMRELDDGFVLLEVRLRPDEAALVLKAAESATGLVTLAVRALRGDAPNRPPVEVMVHVDAATLAGHVEGKPDVPVSAETSRRLLCDAGVVKVLEDAEGNPLDVGRRTRTIPGAIRRALHARDRGCRSPAGGGFAFFAPDGQEIPPGGLRRPLDFTGRVWQNRAHDQGRVPA